MHRAGRESGSEGAPGRSKRAVRSWILYDFANSIYPAVITATVFQIYYVGTIVGGADGVGELWWGRAVAASALIVALTSPLLGAIADRSGARKRFFAAYVAMCLAGVGLMTTLEPGMIVAAFLVFVIANVGFESANVFYNAYLPDIVSPERLGRTSGYGYGLGYLGSALGLLIVLPFAKAGQLEIVWLIVIVFFALFSVPAFRHLPADGGSGLGVRQAALAGIADFRRITAEVWGDRNLRRFLFAFFFYIDGVLTIIVMGRRHRHGDLRIRPAGRHHPLPDRAVIGAGRGLRDGEAHRHAGAEEGADRRALPVGCGRDRGVFRAEPRMFSTAWPWPRDSDWGRCSRRAAH